MSKNLFQTLLNRSKNAVMQVKSLWFTESAAAPSQASGISQLWAKTSDHRLYHVDPTSDTNKKLSYALAADTAGRAEMADGFFDAVAALAKFATDSIGNAFLIKAIADGAFQADAATRALFADGFVTFAKAKAFVSTEQTATGSAQNVVHGLGAVPSKVLIVPTLHPGTPDTGAFTITEGAHDGTNVIVTMTVNCKFKVLAWV